MLFAMWIPNESNIKGRELLTEMFQIFESDPERLLPRNTANRWRNAPEGREETDYLRLILQACRMRTHCGYINNFDLRENPIELMGFFMQTV